MSQEPEISHAELWKMYKEQAEQIRELKIELEETHNECSDICKGWIAENKRLREALLNIWKDWRGDNSIDVGWKCEQELKESSDDNM